MNFDYRQFLKAELERRHTTRPTYSLRAFARDLGLPAPQLSAVLNGKKGLSNKKAQVIAEKLKCSETETSLFVTAVTALHGRSRTEKETALKKMKSFQIFRTIQEAQFRVIADWYHLALLELSETRDFKWDTGHIESRLGISKTTAKEAIRALEQAGLIKKTPGGYVKSSAFIKTEDIPSRAIRLNLHQIAGKAAFALENQPIQERDFASVTIAMDRSRIPELKEKLRQIREEFCVEANKGAERNDVYAFSMQLFRLST